MRRQSLAAVVLLTGACAALLATLGRSREEQQTPAAQTAASSVEVRERRSGTS